MDHDSELVQTVMDETTLVDDKRTLACADASGARVADPNSRTLTASTGHADRQSKHCVHSSLMIRLPAGVFVMQSVGQTRSHRPQSMQASSISGRKRRRREHTAKSAPNGHSARHQYRF